MEDRIERELLVQAPIERVWRVITEPEYVRQWLGSRVEIDLRPGGAANFGWPEEGYDNGWARVERVDPPHVFAFRWMREVNVPFDPAGANTLVEFTLAADGDGTRLRLVESGFTEEAHRKDNEGGWDHELADLAAFLGSGQD